MSGETDNPAHSGAEATEARNPAQLAAEAAALLDEAEADSLGQEVIAATRQLKQMVEKSRAPYVPLVPPETQKGRRNDEVLRAVAQLTLENARSGGRFRDETNQAFQERLDRLAALVERLTNDDDADKE